MGLAWPSNERQPSPRPRPRDFVPCRASLSGEEMPSAGLTTSTRVFGRSRFQPNGSFMRPLSSYTAATPFPSRENYRAKSQEEGFRVEGPSYSLRSKLALRRVKSSSKVILIAVIHLLSNLCSSMRRWNLSFVDRMMERYWCMMKLLEIS